MTEEWKICARNERYEVSSEGHVRRDGRIVGFNFGRYRAAALGRGNIVRIHVLVAESFHGPRPAGMEVRHLNGDGHDNRAENLAWGTRRQNAADTVAHGHHWESIKTHCVHGHEFTAENTAIETRRDGRKKRICRTCKRQWDRDAQVRRKLEVAPPIR
jgi:hypothetical protein